MKLAGAFLEPLRDVYNVKDAVSENVLGYVKKKRLKIWPKFWFEGLDGTPMGEIQSSKKGDKVYNAHNQLQASIRKKQRAPSNKKKSWLGIILFVAGLPILIFSTIIYYHEAFSLDFFETIFIGIALTALGLYCLVSTIEKPEWYIEGSEGQKLAEIKDIGKIVKEFQVLSLDGAIIAHIRKNRGLSAFRYAYSIDITQPVIDPRVIISFTILMADIDKSIATSAPSIPALVL